MACRRISDLDNHPLLALIAIAREFAIFRKTDRTDLSPTPRTNPGEENGGMSGLSDILSFDSSLALRHCHSPFRYGSQRFCRRRSSDTQPRLHPSEQGENSDSCTRDSSTRLSVRSTSTAHPVEQNGPSHASCPRSGHADFSEPSHSPCRNFSPPKNRPRADS